MHWPQFVKADFHDYCLIHLEKVSKGSRMLEFVLLVLTVVIAPHEAQTEREIGEPFNLNA